MPDNFAIKVEHVSKTFKLPHEKQTSIKGAFINLFRGHSNRSVERQQVLNNISFEIKKGEFYGIVGRNGSGKSTLLKLLAGIYTPTSGQIHVRGSLMPFIELGVGFNQELTGRENVFLNGSLLGFNRVEMLEMYDDIVKFAELEKFMDQKLKNYSSGMQVRLAFSIAIRARSDILLLDEVLAVGDGAFQQKCIDYFTQLKKEQKTVVFVSHDMSSVSRFCDRVLVVNAGKIDGIYNAKEGVRRYEDLNLQVELKETASLPLASESALSTGLAPGLIKSIAITSPHGKQKVVTSGEQISCQIVLERQKLKTLIADNDSARYHASASIFNEKGILIASSESQPMTLSASNDVIESTIDAGKLSPGMYSFYFGIYQIAEGDNLRVDATDQPAIFGIKSDSLNVTEGVIQPSVDWKLKEGK